MQARASFKTSHWGRIWRDGKKLGGCSIPCWSNEGVAVVLPQIKECGEKLEWAHPSLYTMSLFTCPLTGPQNYAARLPPKSGWQGGMQMTVVTLAHYSGGPCAAWTKRSRLGEQQEVDCGGPWGGSDSLWFGGQRCTSDIGIVKE